MGDDDHAAAIHAVYACILPKADQGWREAHMYIHIQYSATLPAASHWAQQILDHNLFVGLASHLDIDLSSSRRCHSPCPLSDPITLWLRFLFPERSGCGSLTTPSTI
jgi:hypothetical protein